LSDGVFISRSGFSSRFGTNHQLPFRRHDQAAVGIKSVYITVIGQKIFKNPFFLNRSNSCKYLIFFDQEKQSQSVDEENCFLKYDSPTFTNTAYRGTPQHNLLILHHNHHDCIRTANTNKPVLFWATPRSKQYSLSKKKNSFPFSFPHRTMFFSPDGF
jgi:hypothetical protein